MANNGCCTREHMLGKGSARVDILGNRSCYWRSNCTPHQWAAGVDLPVVLGSFSQTCMNPKVNSRITLNFAVFLLCVCGCRRIGAKSSARTNSMSGECSVMILSCQHFRKVFLASGFFGFAFDGTFLVTCGWIHHHRLSASSRGLRVVLGQSPICVSPTGVAVVTWSVCRFV